MLILYFNNFRIGLRWCNESDLIGGKGIKICGNVSCIKTLELTPFEVNMAYREDNEDKNALVKVYLCVKCGKKLNKSYKYLRRKRKREKKLRK
jgi:protein FRA10AC1